MKGAVIVLLTLACVPALAQTWPAKPITLVAPSTPGSAPDGYTVLLGSIANTLNPHIMAKVGYRILEDFAPASSVAAAPDVLVVHPSFAPKTVGELIAALKAKFPSLYKG